MIIRKVHHAAYRCRDAQETVDFYTEVLGLKYAHAVRTDQYKGEYCPYIHVFFEMAEGSYLAFFELPAHDEQQWDPSTPRWVQHISLQVDDEEALQEAKRRLTALNIEVDGPRTGHTVRALYFYDPSGHRMELAIPLKVDAQACAEAAQKDLDIWNRDKHQYRKVAEHADGRGHGFSRERQP